MTFLETFRNLLVRPPLARRAIRGRGPAPDGRDESERTLALHTFPSAAAVRPASVDEPAPERPAGTLEPLAEPIPDLAAVARAPRPESPRATDDVEKTLYDVESAPKGRVVGVLIAIAGKLEGEIFPLFSGPNTLGRSADRCNVVFSPSDPRISRVHARIDHDVGGFVIEPIADGNPTLVNEEPISGRELLADGDTISLGRTEFRLRVV